MSIADITPPGALRAPRPGARCMVLFYSRDRRTGDLDIICREELRGCEDPEEARRRVRDEMLPQAMPAIVAFAIDWW